MFVTRNSIQWILETASSNSKTEIESLKWYLLNLSPKNEMKSIKSSFHSNLKFWKYLRLKKLLHNHGSKISQIWKFQLHHKFWHYNVHLWWKFQNLLAYYVFIMNFLLFSLKHHNNLKKFIKKSAIFAT